VRNACNGIEGGGVSLGTRSTLIANSNSSFEGNFAVMYGGAIGSRNGFIRTDNVSLEHNVAGFAGGAINVEVFFDILWHNDGTHSDDTPLEFIKMNVLVKSRVCHNLVLAGPGGGIMIVITQYDVNIFPNTGATFILINSLVQGNVAEYGGGIACWQPSTCEADNALSRSSLRLVLQKSLVLDNHAVYGAGFHTLGCEVVASESSFVKNVASQDGGGILSVRGVVSLTNVLVSENTAGNDGGALHAVVSALTVANTSVEYNIAQRLGAGLFVQCKQFFCASAAENMFAISDLLFGITKEDSSLDNAHCQRLTSQYPSQYYDNVTIPITVLQDSRVLANLASHSGAGIHVIAGVMTLNNCLIKGNVAEYGGGICGQGISKISMLRSSVCENEAVKRGGGILIEDRGTLTVEKSEIFANVAGTSYADSLEGQGGGVYASTSTVTLSAGILRQNTAMQSGGGVYLENQSVLIDAGTSTIHGNIAADQGGGIKAVESSIVFAQDTSLEDNVAVHADGGGVHLEKSSLVALNSWMLCNAAGHHGGGIAAVSASSVWLVAMVVAGNNAAAIGGGIHIQESVLTLLNCSLQDNLAMADGGGVAAISSDVSMGAGTCVFANFAKMEGGGLYLLDSALTTYNGSNVMGNSAQMLGGGVFASLSTVELRGSSFQLLRNIAGAGGAFALGSSYLTTNTGSESGKLDVIANLALDGDGGGLLVSRDSRVFLHLNATISYNSAEKNGGGVHVWLAKVEGQTCTDPRIRFLHLHMEGNVALTGDGGGVFSTDHLTLMPNGTSMLTHNMALMGRGGALALSDALLQIRAHVLHVADNFAQLHGGGVALLERASIEMIESAACANACSAVPLRLLRNTAQFGNGGAIYFDSCLRLDKACFLGGIDTLSSTRAILLHDNAAQSGGAIFVACHHIGQCAGTFDDSNTIGSLPLLRKIEFEGNVAVLYGNTVASHASLLVWHGRSPSGLEIVPVRATVGTAVQSSEAGTGEGWKWQGGGGGAEDELLTFTVVVLDAKGLLVLGANDALGLCMLCVNVCVCMRGDGRTCVGTRVHHFDTPQIWV